jgi:rhodanese-related sulfurtransferase
MTVRTELKPLTPAEAKALVDQGRAILVDIRETHEHARENIAGAVLAPLSRIGAGEAEAAAQGKLVIFHCQSGMRTSANAGRLAGTCKGEAYVLAGGLNAWKQAGLPLE